MYVTAVLLFLLSLVGIPPLVGFLGKLYVFGAVVDMGPSYYWYAAVGAVNAAIAASFSAPGIWPWTRPTTPSPSACRIWT